MSRRAAGRAALAGSGGVRLAPAEETTPLEWGRANAGSGDVVLYLAGRRLWAFSVAGAAAGAVAAVAEAALPELVAAWGPDALAATLLIGPPEEEAPRRPRGAPAPRPRAAARRQGRVDALLRRAGRGDLLPPPDGGTVTAVEIDERGRSARLLVDGRSAGRFDPLLLAEHGLRAGRPVTSAQLVALRAAQEAREVWGWAVEFLAARARSTAEVAARLARRGAAPAAIATTIARLTELGYLDDAAFARSWVAARRAAGRGARLIDGELRRHGVDDAARAAALETGAAAGGDEERAAALAAARLARLGAEPPAVQRQRLAGFLARRGFGHAAIAAAIDAALAAVAAESAATAAAAGPDEEAGPDPALLAGAERWAARQRGRLGALPPERARARLAALLRGRGYPADVVAAIVAAAPVGATPPEEQEAPADASPGAPADGVDAADETAEVDGPDAALAAAIAAATDRATRLGGLDRTVARRRLLDWLLRRRHPFGAARAAVDEVLPGR